MNLEQLVKLAEELGVESEDLDDAVHDCAQSIALDELNTIEDEDEQDEHISAQEEYASSINNGGLDSQVEFLLEHTDPKEVEGLIRQAKD